MLVRPTLEAILHVVEHMRALDRREVFAMRWSDNAATLAATVLRRGENGWIATAADGEPVYVFGAMQMWPGVWNLWGFATDRWPEVMLTVTKFIKRNMLPMVGTDVAHRVDCISIAEKVDGHRWLKFLGAVETCDLLGYGRNGENFKLFTWR